MGNRVLCPDNWPGACCLCINVSVDGYSHDRPGALADLRSLNRCTDYPCMSQVSERIRTLFSTVEAAHKGKTILLVSHGDTLSILWATVKGLPLGEHRTHGLSTGELRLLHAAASQ